MSPPSCRKAPELVLAVVDEGDDRDDAECAQPYESLRECIAQVRAGQIIDGDEGIGELLVRR